MDARCTEPMALPSAEALAALPSPDEIAQLLVRGRRAGTVRKRSRGEGEADDTNDDDKRRLLARVALVQRPWLAPATHMAAADALRGQLAAASAWL